MLKSTSKLFDRFTQKQNLSYVRIPDFRFQIVFHILFGNVVIPSLFG